LHPACGLNKTKDSRDMPHLRSPLGRRGFAGWVWSGICGFLDTGDFLQP
jgi:hypothetical protein